MDTDCIYVLDKRTTFRYKTGKFQLLWFWILTGLTNLIDQWKIYQKQFKGIIFFFFLLLDLFPNRLNFPESWTASCSSIFLMVYLEVAYWMVCFPQQCVLICCYAILHIPQILAFLIQSRNVFFVVALNVFISLRFCSHFYTICQVI